ncbi:MAG: ATP-dependent helicase [Filimonas sp.]|nr:ATP-dependent helicase [Filimonas sp.]
MKLTEEQIAILRSSGNIKINAVAGSGKTTTVIEYAKSRPANSKILYLAFNKAVKLDAAKKFEAADLGNVKVETAHSLAYKHIVFKHNYKVRAQGYKTNEIAEILQIQGNGEKHTEFIVANHINKFIAYFCNSDKQKAQDLDYLATITDKQAKQFVSSFYPYIVKQARLFLGKMDKGEIEITHDFYLKKFQVANPQLGYDYILFDEGQDASPAMLDIFLKQKAIKVIVGDTHQQIYGWRYAVNSLKKADFTTYHLSTSFRFSQEIANLAMETLLLKEHTNDYTELKIKGNGNTKVNKTKAILARTNLGLLLKAIEYITDKKYIKKIYFEGNINSYTYADDGTSLYDVLNLYNGKRGAIRDNLIKEMRTIEDLEEYIEKTEDAQLGMMLKIVEEYGSEIPALIKSIKDKNVADADKDKAEMIFSTVHRCKGMEYDSVELVNDFITEAKLKRAIAENRSTGTDDMSRLNEEINLLYVAITRTKNSLHIPETLMPANFPATAKIHLLSTATPELPAKTTKTYTRPAPGKKETTKEKASSFAIVRSKNTDAYKPWTAALDKELLNMYQQGKDPKDMQKHFGRTRGAISLRLKKLLGED